jgi:uncharacterized protein YxjI
MQYFIKQKVFSIKDKFDVLNANQEPVFSVEGKMFSLKNKLEFSNMRGEVLFYAEKQLFKLFPEYHIFNNHGEQVAIVKKKFGFTPKYDVMEGNNTIQVQGNFIAHSFQISKNGQMAASIQKKLISWGDSYMIDIADEGSSVLYLFITIVIDQVAQAAQTKHHFD